MTDKIEGITRCKKTRDKINDIRYNRWDRRHNKIQDIKIKK